MRKFTDLQQELNLIEFFDSIRGTIYTTHDEVPEIMVRRFDGDLPACFVKFYAEITEAMSHWVEERPELSSLIKVETIKEVGEDFIIIPCHIYYESLSAYEDREYYPELPDELNQMRTALKLNLGKSGSLKENIFEEVLAKSLLESSGDTYFDGSKFIVVEPQITREHLERWAALSS